MKDLSRKIMRINKMVLLAVLLLLPVTVLAASTNTAEVDLIIAPLFTTSLSVDTTWYDFGSIDVGTSSNTVTAMLLTNNGNVGITIEKTVWDDDGWDVTLSSTAQDGFDLWAMTKSTDTARPALADYTPGNTHNFDESSIQVFNNLTDNNGSAEDLNPTEKANLWFRLDMPKYVTESRQQKIHIRLKAIAK